MVLLLGNLPSSAAGDRAPAPSPGGCCCAAGGTPDPCPGDRPARPGSSWSARRPPARPGAVPGRRRRPRTNDLDPGAFGPGGVPAGWGHRPNAAGCRVPAAPRPILASGPSRPCYCSVKFLTTLPTAAQRFLRPLTFPRIGSRRGPLIPPLMGPLGVGDLWEPASDRFCWSDTPRAGVRPIDRTPVDGPPSSAHSGRNRGGRTIQPALRAGRAIARISETNLRLCRHPAFPMRPFLHVLLNRPGALRGCRPPAYGSGVSAGRVGRGVSRGRRVAPGARPGWAPRAGSGCPRDRRCWRTARSGKAAGRA
jgi:hypothetical protein